MKNKKRIRILDDRLFLRLPRFSIDSLLKYVQKPLKDVGTNLKEPELETLLDLIKEENPRFYEKLTTPQGEVTTKDAQVLLNYFMRASARTSPYKGFSGIADLSLSEESRGFFEENTIEAALDEKTQPSNSPEPTSLRFNKSILELEDSLTFIRRKQVVSLKHPGVISIYRALKDHNPAKIQGKSLELLQQAGLLEDLNPQPHYFPLDSKGSGSIRAQRRTSISFNLENSAIDKDTMESIAHELSDLAFLSGNSVSKSFFWLERLRKEIFARYGTRPQKLLPLVLSEDSFHEPMEALLSAAQSQITPERRYFMERLREWEEQGGNEFELGESDVYTLKNLASRSEVGKYSPTDLSSRFTSVVRILQGCKQKAYVNYFRASYGGLRQSGQYLRGDHIEDSMAPYKGFENCVFADIMAKGTCSKEVLLTRPRSTSYVINLEDYATGPEQEEISLDDLYIYASSHELVLFSKKLGKRVIPVLTSAYLAENDGNPLFRFLAALGKSHFNAGMFIDILWLNRSYYPRITYKNLILFPRTWVFSKKVLLQRLSEDKGFLPQFVRLVEGDRDAFLDTRSEAFFEMVKKVKSSSLMLQEDFSIDSSICTTKGRWINEVMFSFEIEKHFQQPPFKEYSNHFSDFNHDIEQVEVYAPTGLLFPVLDSLYSRFLKGREFYYIHYQIPSPHLRLRIFDERGLSAQIIQFLLKQKDRFCIAHVANTPFEEELATYESQAGLEVYWRYSKAASTASFEARKVCDALGATPSRAFGPLGAMIYLSLLLERVSRAGELQFYLKDFSFESGHAEYKSIWSFVRAELKKQNRGALAQIFALVENNSAGVIKAVNEWERLYHHGKVSKASDFFIARIFHMEIFRLSEGKHPDANLLILKLAKDIRKDQLRRKV